MPARLWFGRLLPIATQSRERPMKPLPILYHHPISTSCAAMLRFAAERGVALEHRAIDPTAAQQAGPQYVDFNADLSLLMLVDGPRWLTGSAAIQRYLEERATALA